MELLSVRSNKGEPDPADAERIAIAFFGNEYIPFVTMERMGCYILVKWYCYRT